MDGYVGGFMSGVAQTLIGHPLDTLKTWRQNTSATKNVSEYVAWNTISNDPITDSM